MQDSPPRITLPARPAPPPPPAFPLMALIAPVLGAAVLWAVTRSPYALVFAVLGPVIALGTMVDARRQRRKALRRSRREHAEALERAGQQIDQAHARERRQAWAASPGFGAVEAVLTSPGALAGLPSRADEPIVLGSAPLTSRLRLDTPSDAAGSAEASGSHDDFDTAVQSLADRAALLADAPALADASNGVIVRGPAIAAKAVIRSLALQLFARSDADAIIEAGETHRAWAGPLLAQECQRSPNAPSLPHTDPDGDPDAVRVIRRADGNELGWFARDPAYRLRAGLPSAAAAIELPGESGEGVLVRATAVRGALGMRAGERRALAVRHVDEAHARAIARELQRMKSPSADAADAGSTTATDPELPGRLTFSSLPHGSVDPAPGSLSAVIGADRHGRPVELDLVRGPHALVAGMTGTGKSELLITWVLSLVRGRSPDDVVVLLVDFKGGATFAGLAALPHCVGIVTDLDHAGAARALHSLEAELRFREERLSERRCRSIDDDGHGLPRLVVMIDEAAALMRAHPPIGRLLADIASRGRSLGVHLVLCTQRPTGVVDDDVLSNTGIRVCLRVNNRADSVAVIGDGTAHDPDDTPGRAWIAGRESPVQLAMATASDVDRIVAGSPAPSAPLRRPWLDPLPSFITHNELARVAGRVSRKTDTSPTAAPCTRSFASPFAIGAVDLPREQRRELAVYAPHRDGPLLIVGARGSGKSTLLRSLQSALPHQPMPARGVEAVWDAVEAADAASPGPREMSRMLLLDDIDAVHGLLDEEQRAELTARLNRIMRADRAVVVMTARRAAPVVQQLLHHFDSRLLLRLTDRHDHLMLGGDPQLYSSVLGPGAGEWRGARIQLAIPDGGHAFSGDGRGDSRADSPCSVNSESVNPESVNPESVSNDAARPRSSDSAAAGFDARLFQLRDDRDYAVVTGAPERALELLRRAADEGRDLSDRQFIVALPSQAELAVSEGGVRRALVAHPDEWLAAWGVLQNLQRDYDVIAHEITASQVRQLTGERRALPPITRADAAWLLRRGQRPQRISLA
ncbi:FtsK/SpoIIIE domain-containing protein [Ruicaihuangia caeni]|uniref:FtsK/SpoIIIE domain-containing protein n=1 Tax=Ruicaihuangia caeni TaxID=3042517 RepID=A0AAW6T2E1_9MICO|nr:FtsK/SpoIIIE domain-containing protein [Klugiella sp. YN-L-19]MDI2097494.1 FtsK/SpoIIIE domain-containing protein [Klugiella sp. YN-L-19]